MHARTHACTDSRAHTQACTLTHTCARVRAHARMHARTLDARAHADAHMCRSARARRRTHVHARHYRIGSDNRVCPCCTDCNITTLAVTSIFVLQPAPTAPNPNPSTALGAHPGSARTVGLTPPPAGLAGRVRLWHPYLLIPLAGLVWVDDQAGAEREYYFHALWSAAAGRAQVS